MRPPTRLIAKLRRGGLAMLAVSVAMVAVAALPAREVTGTVASPAAVSPIPGASDLQWVRSPQFKATLGTLRPSAAPSGAYGINARWEAGTSTVWYVSQQEVAADSIAYGIANDDVSTIDLGLKELDWAFDHMQPDGSFEPQYTIVASQVISSVLFVSAAARGLLLLQHSSYGPQHAARIDAYLPRLARAVAWFTADARWEPWRRHVDGETGYGIFLHQHYAAATAIGLTSLLTGDRSQMPKALERIAFAVARQSTVGWNPAIDGPDSGYGALGVSSALRFAQWLPASSATPSLMAMLARAVDWERSRIAADGWINWAGNTRTCVPREGMKDPGYSTMADHLGAWGVMEDRPDLFAPASAALAFARTSPSRRCEDRGGSPPGGTWSAPVTAVPAGDAGGRGAVAVAGGGGGAARGAAAAPATRAGEPSAQSAAPAAGPGNGATPRSAPVGSDEAVTCPAIPRLTGATLTGAKRRLARADCADTPVRTVGPRRTASHGKRRAAKRAQVERARVIRQTPAPGASRRGGQEIILRLRATALR
ncbi:MAG: hypothetical protein U0S48_19725 [Solirubrobacteraceae bacterium]